MKTYKGIEIQGAEWTTYAPGRYYLIRRSPTMHERGPEVYLLSTEPGRTNQSRRVELHGWLGTTDDVARFAEGCVEVYKNKAGHLRIRPCADIQPEAVDG